MHLLSALYFLITPEKQTLQSSCLSGIYGKTSTASATHWDTFCIVAPQRTWIIINIFPLVMHSSVQLLPITPATSMSSFTSRLFFSAPGSAGINSLWWERPRQILNTVCLHNVGQWICGGTFFLSISYNSCCNASVKMDGKRSHLMSQLAVSSLQKCPALYLGVGLPVH